MLKGKTIGLLGLAFDHSRMKLSEPNTHPAPAPATVSLAGIQLVFLDRDGVINEKPPEGEYVRHWGEFNVLPGVEAAIRRLNQAGKRVIMVTNQRGIALGLYGVEDLEKLHDALKEHLASHGAWLDEIYFCPHDKEQCECRKPKTGMLQRALRAYPYADAAHSMMIGDSYSDIQAGRNLGMPTIFIRGDRERRKAGAKDAEQEANYVVENLSEAVDLLLGPAC